MPYSVSNPPEQAKSFCRTTHEIHIWIRAFNAALETYGGDEAKAFATAYMAVKKYRRKNVARHKKSRGR